MKKLLKVKKYSNRKYYIEKVGMCSLENLKKEVENGFEIVTTCHKTGGDITKQTLLKMVSEDKFTKKELIDLVRK
jgi:polyhydroxyalkanoate synthesis regulator protein